MAKEKIYKSEKDVKEQIKTLLKKRGWFYWMPPANGFGKVGIADLHALRAGVFLAVEAKFGKNKCSPHQKAFIQSILAEEGMAFVVSDRTIQDFETWLDAFDRAVTQTSQGKPVLEDDGALMLNAIAKMTELAV